MRRPIVWTTVCFVLGYAWAKLYPAGWLNLYVTLGAAIGITIVATIRPRGWTLLCAALIAAMAAGYYGEIDARNVTRVPAQWAEQTVILRGQIVTPVEVDGDKASFVVEGKLHAAAAGGDKSGDNGFEDSAGKGASSLHPEKFQINVKLARQEEQGVAAGWRRGALIELEGTLKAPAEARNFGGFDYGSYLRLHRIHWLLQAKGTDNVSVQPGSPFSFAAIAGMNDTFRAFLGEEIAKTFPAEQAGFMKSMLIGDTGDMDPLQFQQFSGLGLTHILAVSGLNVAIFVGCLMWVLRKAGCTRETCLITSLCLLPFYIAVTGASPSIVRAGLMGMIALYAAYKRILKDGLHSVTIVALVMLLADPYYLFDVSFQLSFLVTIGLIVGVPLMNRLLPPMHRTLRDALSIALVSQLISFPVSVYYFNQLSLLSLPANLFLVPVFSLVTMPGGTLALLVHIVWESGGSGIGWLVGLVNRAVFVAVDWLGSWDGMQTYWPSPSLTWMCLYYASLIILLVAGAARGGAGADIILLPDTLAPAAGGGKNMAVWLTPLVAGCSLIGLLVYSYSPDRLDRDGKVQFIDVGQGDSILIRTPETAKRILIDGGGTVTFRKPGEQWKERKDPYEVGRKLLVPLLKQRGVHRLDYVILTHEDQDHYGGLQAVIEQIPVGTLVFNGSLKPDSSVEKLFAAALKRGVRLAAAYGGQQIVLDERTKLDVLYPFETQGRPIRLEKEQNGQSVVFVMNMDGTRWLFTGDLGLEQEHELLLRFAANQPSQGGVNAAEAGNGELSGEKLLSAPIDVIKIGHHGSKSSTSEPWLDAWKPKVAVISAGVNNVYRHPSGQTLDRLQSRSIPVFRTDRHGEIDMTVRDGRIWVRTKLAGELAGNVR